MKPFTNWVSITPCLAVSLFFADFTRLNADTPGQGQHKPVPKRAAQPQAAPARPTPAPTPSAAPKRPASAQPQKQAPSPKPAPAPVVPKRPAAQQAPARPTPKPQAPKQAPATTPEAARARQQQNQPKNTPAPAKPDTSANEEAARARQAERVADNQQKVQENQADRAQRVQDNQQKAQNNQEAARQAAADRQQKVQENQADRAQRVQDNQQKAQDNQEAARQAAADRQQKAQENQADRAQRVQDNQQKAQDNQEAARQAASDRQQKAQDNAARVREQQQENRGNVADNLERQREALRQRAQDNQARVRENQANNQDSIREAQSRLREQNGDRLAETQARIRDAQERSRQAQANLNSRQLENIQQRRDAYNNARQLAAEARRPILERPSMNFRPGWTEARDPSWQNRWGNSWNQVAEARAANRVASNYQRAVNWSYQPNYWGSRPWWNNNVNQNWYQGSWNYGWNRSWQRRNSWYGPQAWPGYSDRSSIGSGIAWGLSAWGLGNLIYDSGYETYYNPYPTRYAYNDTQFAYDEPISTIAARYPAGDEDQSKTSAEKSSIALERSRSSFKDEDYLAALKSVDEAIAFVPGDSSLHEYRALVLFALGQYGDAAGVLNTVLASSPGWDYKTMISMYRVETTYNGQLTKLESYVDSKPDAADARFVLGYHHMVGGDLDSAGNQFEEVVRLQPRDSIAKQLRDLVRSSVKDPGANSEPVEGENIPDVAPIASERLVGNWTSDRGGAGKVELSLKEDGKFTWIFERSGKGDDKNLSGTYSIDDRGLLVLNADNSQMVGEISMPSDGQLVFVLAGGPDGDPGLNFSRN